MPSLRYISSNSEVSPKAIRLDFRNDSLTIIFYYNFGTGSEYQGNG